MVNKWYGIGNLTKDPLVGNTPSGKTVCNFSIACNEKFNGQERVEYINIVVWGKLAEIAGKYLQKGKMVYLEGRLTTRSYDDRDGNKRYVTEIVADQMRMLGGREESQRTGNNARTDQQRSEPRQQTTQHRSQQYDEPAFNPDDSDIPF